MICFHCPFVALTLDFRVRDLSVPIFFKTDINEQSAIQDICLGIVSVCILTYL